MNTAKYLKFTTEEFILDNEFSAWVLNPDEERNLFWESFLVENPEKKEQVEDASLIIKSIQPIQPEIPEQQLHKILQNVRAQDNAKILSGYGWLKYAASVVLLITAGGLIWLLTQTKNQFPVEASNESVLKGKIIFANGLTREFNTEQTTIKQNSKGSLTINNDTIEVSDENENTTGSAMNQIVIPLGQRSEVTLADGTHIWLNSGSQLYYPAEFKSSSREVYLIGEAFFDVTHDDKRAFYVTVRDFKIKVLGTSFNVSSYTEDQTIETVLVKGKVSAGKNKLFAETIDLTPGERMVYDKNNESLSKDRVDVNLFTSWVNGYLIFDNEPITEVFKKLKRYYKQDVVTDTGLEKVTFSGKLDLKDNLRNVLETISFASSVTLVENNGTFTIKKGGL